MCSESCYLGSGKLELLVINGVKIQRFVLAVCTNWSRRGEASFPIQAKNKTSDAVIQIRYKTGMSTVAVQFLTEALTGTMGAHKGQSVRDPPDPNRIRLKKDEDFCKPGLLFSVKMCQRTHFSFLSLRGRVGTKAAAMTANVASFGSMKSHHCSL